MKKEDLQDLRDEINRFMQDRCVSDEEGRYKEENNEDEFEDFAPIFVDVLNEKLLAPAHSGVYLSRLDLKRVAEAIDESIPIKERSKMIKTLFRHTNSKEFLKNAFDEFKKHIIARIYIYEDLMSAFPSSSYAFSSHIEKAKKIQKVLDTIVEEFEEIEPTDDPMLI
ncbi:MAG: hypothetical protein WCR69_05125 [Sulfuricurvum sp.]